jgi:hypothetical protein
VALRFEFVRESLTKKIRGSPDRQIRRGFGISPPMLNREETVSQLKTPPRGVSRHLLAGFVDYSYGNVVHIYRTHLELANGFS